MDKALNRVDQAKVRSWRIRTIFYSIIAAGLTSLFIGNIVETSNYNSRVEENMRFCNAIYDDREFLRDISNEVATAARMTGRPDTENRWRSYEIEFESRLPPNLRDCKDIYEKRSYIPFIE